MKIDRLHWLLLSILRFEISIMPSILLRSGAWKTALFSLFTFASFSSTIVVANPTTKDVTKPLATHNTLPEAGPLAAALYTVAIDAEKFIIDSEAALMKKGAESLNPKLLSQWTAKVSHSFREAEHLRTMGEPASTDLLHRLNANTTRLNPLIQAYVGTRPGQILSAKLLKQLQKEQPEREKQYEKIKGMVAAQQFKEAEAAINKIGLEIGGSLPFVGLSERQPIFNPYMATRGLVDPPMLKIRITTAQKKFLEAIASNRPNAAALATWASTAAGQLKSTGKATIDGKEATGPQVLDALSQRWGAGHGSFQRIAGLHWALRWHGEGSNSGLTSSDTTAADATAWADAAITAIGTIITAHAESVQAADVPALHRQYMTSLAAMASLGESRKIQTKASEAFAPLLAKNSVYEASVKNYDLATRDLMTFQSRIANATTAEYSKKFGIADSAVREATRAQGANPGLHPESPATPSTATLSGPADKTLITAMPKLVNKIAYANGVVRISPTSKTSAVEFQTRTYGTTFAVPMPEPQVRQIKQDLLVDDTHVPLSVAATKAIDSAILGHYVAVGGTIASAQLEAMITRAIMMSDGAAIVVPRGTTIQEGTAQTMMNQMAVRIDIDPSWIQHELVVFKIPGK